MADYLDITDLPGTAAALDAKTGEVLFLCGLDRQEALANMQAYAGASSKGGTLNTSTLTYEAGDLTVHGAWECDIGYAAAQDTVWLTPFAAIVIEDSLAPSDLLVQVLDAIVTYYA